MGKAPVSIVAALILAAVASGSTTPLRTTIVTWNPFRATGIVKPGIAIERLGRGDCINGPSSEIIGDLGYRCVQGHLLADPCWRDGLRPTDFVLCPRSPWDRRAALIRVPHFMLAAGVTYAAPIDARRDPPWGLETRAGSRCLLSQGAHDSVTLKNGRRLVVDYACDRGGVVLLRNLRRGRVWRIGSARWTGQRYALLGDVVIRRAVFPSLPPEMQRQNDVARAATSASGLRSSRLLRVRISFPALDWAYVEALAPDTSKALSVWSLVHRIGRSWKVAHLHRPPCSSRVPATARRQLFGCNLPASTRARLDR